MLYPAPVLTDLAHSLAKGLVYHGFGFVHFAETFRGNLLGGVLHSFECGYLFLSPGNMTVCTLKTWEEQEDLAEVCRGRNGTTIKLSGTMSQSLCDHVEVVIPVIAMKVLASDLGM